MHERFRETRLGKYLIEPHKHPIPLSPRMKLIGVVKYRSVGWLVGWLVSWLGGWLVGWLAGWLVGWLVSWLGGWLVGWLGG